MQQEKNNNKAVTILSWFLVLICMAVIFWLSSRTADESAAQSGVIVEWIIEHFGDNSVTDFIVRKLAHFCEYIGLCFLISNAIYQTKKKNIALGKLTDMIVPSLILAQAIGRWGNFFNQEAHGAATTYEHLKSLHIPKFIIDNMKIDGIYYTPTFLYESIACLTLFIIFLF